MFYYKLYGAISDITSQQSMTLFDPIATQVMGMSANQFAECDVTLREKLLTRAFEASLILKLIPPRDDSREKLVVAAIDPRVDYWEYLK